MRLPCLLLLLFSLYGGRCALTAAAAVEQSGVSGEVVATRGFGGVSLRPICWTSPETGLRRPALYVRALDGELLEEKIVISVFEVGGIEADRMQLTGRRVEGGLVFIRRDALESVRDSVLHGTPMVVSVHTVRSEDASLGYDIILGNVSFVTSFKPPASWGGLLEVCGA